MSASVPWSVSAVDPDTWDAAREAARRDGLSVGEWLEAAIRENARGGHARGRNPATNFDHRLDDLAEQINMLARRNVYSRPNPQPVLPPRDQGSELIVSSLDALSDRIEQVLEGMERAQRNNGRDEISSAIRKLDSRIESILLDRPASNQDSEVETKLDEMARVISQMSERLEREVAAATASPSLAPQAIPTADELDAAVAEIMERQSMLDGTPMRRISARTAPAAAPAATPAPQFANLERQLKTIADEMQSIRKSNAKNAQVNGPITELRRDIAELARSMAELAPRRTLESLEHTVEALTRKIDRATTHSQKDNRSAQAVLTALDEIRVALANVRPAESFISVEGDLNALSEKLDVINAKSIDGTTVARIQNQVQEVRDLLSNALPHENLQAVVAQIETIASKVERISAPDDSGVRGIVGGLEERIDALAHRIEQSAQQPIQVAHDSEAFDRIHHRLDALQMSLDKAENPMGLEETMRSVVERLDASEAKLSNLGAIERGISDLSTQFDKARANAMDVAERAAKTALRELRAASQTMPQQVAAAQAAAHPVSADVPAAKPLAGEPQPARRITEVMVPAEQQRFTRVAPVTVQSREAVIATDGLPADYPLEPGSGAPRSRSTPVQQRIAQSEAAVADIAPRTADGNTKTSDFIAAARRAAQAAAAESTTDTPSDDKKKGAISGIFARSRRAVLLGLVVAMLGFSAVRFFDVSLITNLVGGTETSNPSPAPAPMQTPPAEQTPAKPESPTFVPEPQQRSLVPGFGDPFGPLAPTGDITPQTMVSLFAQPDAQLTTQSTRQGPRSQQVPLQTQNAVTNNQPQKPAADQPAGIAPALLQAANGGDPDAAFEVGERYLTGNGVEANATEALKWFEKAVAKGSAAAAFRLGMAYEKGQGVTRDRARARTNYVLAADSGHLKAMHNLAVMMVEDGGAKPDYANAVPWFRRAAERGLRDSQYNLGVIYARGFGVSQNLTESFLWFSLAANQGDADAAKKRDDVASRLDQQTLVASRLAVQTWSAKPSNESVNAPRVKPEWQNAAVGPKKKQKK
jgi:localization factor PodJL